MILVSEISNLWYTPMMEGHQLFESFEIHAPYMSWKTLVSDGRFIVVKDPAMTTPDDLPTLVEKGYTAALGSRFMVTLC